MNALIKYVLMAAGAAGLVGTIWLTQSGSALAQATKVILAEVVNAPDNPVPVTAQGTTRVAGAVNIAGTPVVEIASSDHDPVIVRHAGDCAPFHTTLFLQIPDGQSDGSISFFVPADRRLVIEQVTIKATAPASGYVQTSIRNTVDGLTISPDLIMVSQGMFGDTKILLASQNVRWYADPGTEVEVTAGKSFTELAYVYATISGYLVECPRAR